MFKVSRRLPISGKNCLPVFELLDSMGSHVDHRFYRQNHSIQKLFTSPPFSVVGNFWGFMHSAAKTVSYQFTNHAITFLFTVVLYGISQISNPIVEPKGFYSFIQGFFGYSEEFFGLWSNFTNRKSIGMIAIKSIF